jgi:CheY-like chemotaxis protein
LILPPETQARAFGPFFTTKARGRGIGLAVVSGTVRKLGGAIQLASEPGSGTTVQILLPCAESESPARNQAVRPSAGTLRPIQGASILIVEDEDALRQAASKMLRRTGFSITEARKGSDALDAIRKEGSSIDVLLLDITLPGAPSWQVFQEAMRLRGEVKVIVTSAYGEEAAETALRAPVPYFLRKPYKIGDLTELVRQILA